MAINKYFSGDTIRIKFSFFGYDKTLVDPTIVRIKFFDDNQEKIEEFTLAAENKVSTGNYYYDYTTDNTYSGVMYYEIYGEIDGNPSVSRNIFELDFI